MAIQLFPTQNQNRRPTQFERPAPIAENIKYEPCNLQLFPQYRRNDAPRQALTKELTSNKIRANRLDEINTSDLGSLFYKPETAKMAENRSDVSNTAQMGAGATGPMTSGAAKYGTNEGSGTTAQSQNYNLTEGENAAPATTDYKPDYGSAAASGLGAAGTTAYVSGASAGALGTMGGIGAGIYGTYRSIQNVREARERGERLNTQQTAEAWSPEVELGLRDTTFTPRWVNEADPAAQIMRLVSNSSLYGSKHPDQYPRDSMVQRLIDMGAVHDQGPGHYLTRADGSAYDIFGEDGKVPGTERASYDINLNDPLSTSVTPLAELFATIIAGEDGKPATDMAGYLVNAAVSNAQGSYDVARSNMLSFLRSAGITTLEQLQDQLSYFRQNGLISEDRFNYLTNVANSLVPGKQQYTNDQIMAQWQAQQPASVASPVPTNFQSVVNNTPSSSKSFLPQTTWKDIGWTGMNKGVVGR